MTPDDAVPEHLAALAREQHREEQLLEGLLEGSLSDEERAELHERAARSPELAAAVRLAVEPEQEQAEQSPVVSLSSRREASGSAQRWWTAGGLVAAAAAAAAVLALWPAGPELPRYALTHEGAVQPLRGEEMPNAEQVQMLAATTVTWVLAPEVDTAPPELHLFLNGEPKTWPYEVSETGSLRVSLQGATLGLGEHELRFVVCQPEVCEEALRAEAYRGPGWERFVVEVVVRP